MNVGLYVTSLTPKGASQMRFQAGVFNGLKANNRGRHHFFVFSNHVPSEIKNDDTFTYITIRRDRYWSRFWNSKKRAIAKIGFSFFQKTRWDQIFQRWGEHEPGYYQQIKESGVRIMWFVNPHELSSWLPYIKTVWDVNQRIHTMYPEFSYTRFKFENLDQMASITKASYIITGTEEGKTEIVSMFGVYKNKVRVIPFPTPILPEISSSFQKPAFKNKAPYLFYPARFWPHKNHVVIIEALKILKEKHNCILNLVFSGADEGNLGYVLRYAEKLRVRDQMAYVGLVEEAELVGLYKNAFALVFAAAVGPDNLPPLEAMSLGCPAIVTEVPGAREQFGESALFFYPTDERGLSACVMRLLKESGLRESLIEKGQRRSKEWTVTDYASEVMAILNEFESIARAWEVSDAVFT